jgi:Stress responsive A/B Barrel Domain
LIRHIVVFRLIDRTPESVGKAADVLRGLIGKVPTLRALEVGVDVLRSERSWDIALTALFDSLDDLEAYRVHPEHQKVVRYMESVRDAVASADYAAL